MLCPEIELESSSELIEVGYAFPLLIDLAPCFCSSFGACRDFACSYCCLLRSACNLSLSIFCLASSSSYFRLAKFFKFSSTTLCLSSCFLRSSSCNLWFWSSIYYLFLRSSSISYLFIFYFSNCLRRSASSICCLRKACIYCFCFCLHPKLFTLLSAR